MTAQSLEELAGQHGIELLLRFGSTAGGVPHAASDVDLAVRLRDREPSLDRLVALEAALQPLFPEGRVDLAFLDRADPLFLKKILERCELLVGGATPSCRAADAGLPPLRRSPALPRDGVGLSEAPTGAERNLVIDGEQ